MQRTEQECHQHDSLRTEAGHHAIYLPLDLCGPQMQSLLELLQIGFATTLPWSASWISVAIGSAASLVIPLPSKSAGQSEAIGHLRARPEQVDLSYIDHFVRPQVEMIVPCGPGPSADAASRVGADQTVVGRAPFLG